MVDVALVPLAVSKVKLVELKFVELTLVKIPAAGVVKPIEEPLIGVLVTVPPLIVRPSTTMASAMELVGKFKVPDTFRLVVLALVKMALVEVTIVPEALVNVRPEAVNEPDKIKLPAEVNRFDEEKN